MASTEKTTCLYLYGITAADVTPPQVSGVLDATVTTVAHGDVAAIVSPLSSTQVRAKRRDLLRHSEVLQAVFRRTTVLPFRFGIALSADADVVDAVLAPRHDELAALLRQFDGLAEMRLRARYRDLLLADVVREDARLAALRDATVQSAPGDPRLVQLGEGVARGVALRRERDTQALMAALTPLATDVVVDELQEDLELMRVSFLVRSGDVGAFDARLADLVDGHAGRVAATCTGPLPPHSFVALSLEGP